MSAQTNAELARQGYALFNAHDFESLGAMVTDDVQVVDYAFGRTTNGRNELIQLLRDWKTPFPDGEVTILRQDAGEDFVVNQNVFRATHTQPMETPNGTIPATGRKVTFNFVEVWKIRNGKLARIDNYVDSASLLRQLGVMS